MDRAVDLSVPPAPGGAGSYVVEAVCADDRAWFERNPGKDRRFRPVVPDESPVPLEAPPEGAGWFVRVARLDEGCLREFALLPLPAPPGLLSSIGMAA